MSAQSPITFLQESSLIRRAAELRELTLPDEPRNNISHLEFDSEVVGTFKLDKDFIAALEGRGFTFGPGRAPPHNEMLYLDGHSNQRYESDCWAWKNTETDPRLTVHFRLRVAEKGKGIVCEPHVWGNCKGGAAHRPTINRLVKTTSDHFSDLHFLIQAAAKKDTPPVIHWSEIELGGVKSVEQLFNELFRRNERAIELARSNISPFDPNPNPPGTSFRVWDRPFVPEDDQPKLFEQWEEQLQAFKVGLD